MSDELEYWRALAIERGRALEELHARMRNALALVPDSHFLAVAAALDGRAVGWIRETERMEPPAELRPTDVLSALDDLWKRVDADGGR